MDNLSQIAHADPVLPTEADSQFVTFSCGKEHYGIPVMSVREIRSWQPTTQIPGRPSAARGVLDIRGMVVEVFDLAALLGGQPIEATPGSVVLVLTLEDRVIGLLVDAVSDIIQVQPGDKMPVPPHGHQNGAWSGQVTFMVSYEDRLIGVLDLDAVFH